MAGLGQFFKGLASGIAPEVDQRRAMANAAIQQLQGVNSPQAQHWMQQLHANPGQALAAAEAFGGIGAVSQGLQAAQAQARAQQEFDAAARGAGLSDLERIGFRSQGGTGLKAVREAMGMGGPEPFEFKNANALRKDYTARSGDFETIRHFYEIAASNAAKAAEDPENPGAVDFALVQAYGKMLDPNSVVRNEEGKFIAESQSSTVEDAINRFARLFSAAGTLNPTARRNLMRQIQATYDQAATRQKGLIEEMNTELDNLGAQGVLREFALPIGLGLSEVKLDLSPWEDVPSRGESRQSPASASDASVGQRVQRVNPETGQTEVYEKVQGGWDLVQ